MLQKLLLTLSLFFSSFFVHADNHVAFIEDHIVLSIAEGYAMDCVNLMQAKFETELDGTEASIPKLTVFYDKVRQLAKDEKLNPLEMRIYSNMLGFYMGEVLRKSDSNLIWGRAIINGKREYALGKADSNEAIFQPPKDLAKLIHEGESITTFYNQLKGK